MKPAKKPWSSLPRPVVVAVLGELAGKRHIPATLMESGGQQLKLQLETELAPQTAIKIEVDGGLVLGAVLWSQTSGSSFVTTIEVDQVIPDAAGLARLVSAVLGQTPPAAAAYRPQDRRHSEQPEPQAVLRPSPR